MFKRLSKWWTRRRMIRILEKVLREHGVSEEIIKKHQDGMADVMAKWLKEL